MQIEIKHRWNNSVLFAHDAEENSLKITLLMALKANANLSGANLSGADLRGADLRGANLRGAELTVIRDDLWAVLSSAPREVAGLIDAIKNGRVDGSTYTGNCTCLVGSLANIAKIDYQSFETLKPNSSRPIERFFLSIKKGDTPETSPFSKLALEWTELWLNTQRAAFDPTFLPAK